MVGFKVGFEVSFKFGFEFGFKETSISGDYICGL
jgi:hypothetical protein